MTAQRRSSRLTRRSIAQGVAIAGLLVVALVGFGGANDFVRLLLHAGVCATLAGVAFLPDRQLRRGGLAWACLGVAAPLIAVSLLGWMPVPSAIGRWLSPSWVRDRGTVGWDFLSFDPFASTEAAAGILLVAAFGVLVAIWSGVSKANRAFDTGVIGWVILVVLLGNLPHVVTETYLGIFPLSTPTLLHGPFVGQNHLGASLLLPFPILLMRLYRGPHRGLYGVLAAATLLTVVRAGSSGPLLVMGLQVAAVLGIFVRPWLALLPLLGIVPLVFVAGLEPDMDWSLHGRVPVWWASVGLFFDHWAFGSGVGSYATAIEPYRLDFEHHRWNHAHNEWIEWLTDGGLLGILALPVSALAASRFWGGYSPRAAAAWVGLAGIAVHSLIDFPLRVPAIALAAVAVLVTAGRVRKRERLASGRNVRIAVLIALVAEIGATGWQARTWYVGRRASVAVRTGEPAPGLAETLGPDRAVFPLVRARRAVSEGRDDVARGILDQVSARYVRDASALRTAARLYLAIGALPEAERTIDRAVEWSPADYRNWLTRAQIAERSAPDRAAAAYVDVLLRAEAPPRAKVMERGWSVLPLGLYWAEAVSDAPLDSRKRVANFLLGKGDLDSVDIIAEEMRVDGLGSLGLAHATALAERGRSAEARVELLALLDSPERIAALRLLAELDEEEGQWEDAARRWGEVWRADERPRDRTRWLRARVEVHGPKETLRFVRGLQGEGEHLAVEDLFLKAHLEATLGEAAECRQTLQDSRLSKGRTARKREKAMKACTPPRP